ncbi:MAG TPA: hypothetical protein ENK57_02140 [Polyangiaceae bacterium]|nr:hypothetical protein [Polyangiaceae bacterium]
MIFFERQLAQRLNSDDEDVAEKADREFSDRVAAYEEHLRCHSDRLPASLVALQLHDARVVEITIQSAPVAVRVALETPNKDVSEIRYLGVWRIEFSHDISRVFAGLNQRSLHDIFADEVILHPSGRPVHGILMHSGAELEVGFEDVVITA